MRREENGPISLLERKEGRVRRCLIHSSLSERCFSVHNSLKKKKKEEGEKHFLLPKQPGRSAKREGKRREHGNEFPLLL